MNAQERYQLETIPLTARGIISGQFLMLPHGEWMFAYVSPEDPKGLQVILKSTPTSEWTEKNPQNTSNFAEIVSQKGAGEVKTFTMLVDNFGDLCMFVNVQEQDLMTVYLYKSANYGKSWAVPHKISPAFESWKVAGHPILLKTGPFMGEYVLPLDHDILQRALVLLSTDNGKHWSPSLYLEPPEQLPQVTGIRAGASVDAEADADDPTLYGTFSPKICEISSGLLRIFCRVTDSREIHTYLSRDNGNTWEDPRPCEITGLAPDTKFDLLCVNASKNQTHQHPEIFLLGSEPKEGGGGNLPTLWRSSDEGLTFTQFWQADHEVNQPYDYCQLYQSAADTRVLYVILASAGDDPNAPEMGLQIYTMPLR